MPKNKLIALIAAVLITTGAVLALVLFFHRNDPPVNAAVSTEIASHETVESVESDEAN